MAPSTTQHARSRVRSYQILSRARAAAKIASNYDSNATRATFTSAIGDRLRVEPRSWQLDVGEALRLGLDCVVIAGTGAGKTMPFMMPCLLDERKKVVIISPLKILQEEQAQRFEEMKITAAAVNGETWDSALKKDLEDGRYQGIFTSPEMCLKHPEFRQLLTSSNFGDIAAVIVDEAHCIAQWGGDFRTAYSEIGKLCAFFPSHIPFLATSATLPSHALQEVRTSLGIDADECFYLNLGNDRPNVAYSVRRMQSANDYEALKPLLSHTPTPTTPDDLRKTVIFTNEVQASQLTAREVRSWFPHLHKCVDYIHSRRSPKARRRAMARFRNGKTRILIATEAAGMGADIPDIEQVIQFGVPSSLSVWMQRAGRAGCDPQICARAILLVEKSMFQTQKRKTWKKGVKKKKRRKDSDTEAGDNSEASGQDDRAAGGPASGDEDEVTGVVASGDEDEAAAGDDAQQEEMGAADESSVLPPGREWRKKVDEDLRRWIETTECRRDVADKYFGNPPDRQAPTGVCCDNCNGDTSNLLDNPDERPSTPTSSDGGFSSQYSTPSKSMNNNGKRPMVGGLPSVRRGPVLQAAREALLQWRTRTKREHYSPSSVTAQCLLPDNILKTLASSRELASVEAIQAKTKWVFAQRHGMDVLSALLTIDQVILDQRAADAQEKAAAAAAAAEKKRLVEERRVQRQTQRSSRRLPASAPDGCDVFSYTPTQPAEDSEPLFASPSTVFSTPTGGVLDFQVSPYLVPLGPLALTSSLPPLPPTPLGPVTNVLSLPRTVPYPRPRPIRPRMAASSRDSENIGPPRQLVPSPNPL